MTEAGIWLPESRRPARARPPGPRPPGARRDAGRRGPRRVGRVAAIRLRTRRAGPRPDRSRARGRRAGRPRRTERQREVDPRAPARRAAPSERRARPPRPPTIRLAWRRATSRAGPATCSRIPRPGSSRARSRTRSLLGLDADERAAAPRLMERLRLPLGTFGDRSPYRLSGGEARRLSLACALIRHPRPARARRAHVRTGPPRLRGAPARSSANASTTGSASSRPPTTGVSSATSPSRIVDARRRPDHQRPPRRGRGRHDRRPRPGAGPARQPPRPDEPGAQARDRGRLVRRPRDDDRDRPAARHPGRRRRRSV